MHIFIKKNYLTYRDYKVKCAVGKRGIGEKKREGDLITPKGVFKIGGIFYRKDKIKSLKTKIKKTIINKNMGWCDDPKSNKYNKLIYYPFKFNSEKLYRQDSSYDIVITLNFNINPVKKIKVVQYFYTSPRKITVQLKVVLQLKKSINKNSKNFKKEFKNYY